MGPPFLLFFFVSRPLNSFVDGRLKFPGVDLGASEVLFTYPRSRADVTTSPEEELEIFLICLGLLTAAVEVESDFGRLPR